MKTKRRKPKAASIPPLYLPSEVMFCEPPPAKQHWYERQSEPIEQFLSKVA